METDTNTASAKKLEDYRIPGLPSSFYYIPDFISPEEEASILSKLPPHRWTPLSHRRLQAHPSTLTRNNTLLAAPLPTYLTTPIVPRLEQLGVFKHTVHAAPNHVLVNEYKPGEGIMAHEDGAAYESVVATVSLGGAVCLSISPRAEDVDGGEEPSVEKEDAAGVTLPTRILQEPRSLLITTGEAYETLLHGIDAVEVDEGLGGGSVANWGLLGEREAVEREGRSVRGTRVSLTYRDVRKVSGVLGRVLGTGRR